MLLNGSFKFIAGTEAHYMMCKEQLGLSGIPEYAKGQVFTTFYSNGKIVAWFYGDRMEIGAEYEVLDLDNPTLLSKLNMMNHFGKAISFKV